MKALSRRTLLRGGGVALALPLLEQMMPTRALAQAAVPARFVTCFTPSGFNMNTFWPTGSGSSYALTGSLSPLTPHRDQVTVIRGLDNVHALADNQGAHHRGTSSVLNAATCLPDRLAFLTAGVSADQLMASALRGCTALPSLELGPTNSDVSANFIGGFPGAFLANISYRADGFPVARETSPRRAFQRLFAWNVTPQERQRLQGQRLSLLHHVHADATRLRARLGRSDQLRLDQYLNSVAEVEQRVMAGVGGTRTCPQTTGPTLDNHPQSDVRAYNRAMSDLTVLALQCDLTRVVTTMTGGGGNAGSYGYQFALEGKGLDDLKSELHHELSHHQNNARKLEALTHIDTYFVSEWAYLIGQLKGQIEPDGQSLLDHTFVYCTSEVSDGNLHSHVDLPVVVAGGSAHGVRTGRYLNFATHEPLANLLMCALRFMSVPQLTFGNNGTRDLPGLLS